MTTILAIDPISGRNPISGRRQKNPKGYGLAWMTCEKCGKRYLRHKRPGRTRHFCSRKCYLKSLGGRMNPKFRGGPVTTSCAICGMNFPQTRNGTELRKTCSPLCLYKLSRSHKRIGDTQARLCRNVRRSILSYIRSESKGGRKWRDLLGYGPSELMRHLESLFTPGMSWANYGLGGWHVDHKKPVCLFSFETPDDPQFKQCWSLSNLQPLWEKDNLSKGAKYADHNYIG